MGTGVKHPVAPTIRGAFLRALDIIKDKRDKTFSQLLADEIEVHGLLVVMERVGRFQERVSANTVTHDGTVKHEGLPSVDSFLHEHVRAAENSDSEISGPH